MQKRSFVIIFALIVGSFGVAQAQNRSKRKQARVEVEKGRKAQALGDYDKALLHYKRAYDLVPHPELFYNFAQALRLKGDKKKALEYYDRYLTVLPNGRSARWARRFADLLRPVVEAEEKKRVAREKELRDKEAREKELRDKEAREKELHDKEAREKEAREKEQREKEQRDRDGQGLISGQKITITKKPKKRGGGMKIAGLVSVGVGAILIGLGAKFGMDAKSISDELSEEKTTPWTEDELDRQEDGEEAQSKMILFTGIGAAAVIGGTVLYIMGRKKAAASERSLSLTPVVSPNRVGFALSKAF